MRAIATNMLAGPEPTSRGVTLQRKCSCEASGEKCSRCGAKQHSLQRKSNGAPIGAGIPSLVDSVLTSPGTPIETKTPATMESRFEHEFSDVRIHSDAPANAPSREAGAVPYASGGCAKNKDGLQRKLAIGANNDPLELEADRVADQVLAAPAFSTVRGAAPDIQRYAGQSTDRSDAAPSSVDRVLASSGKQMEPALQQDMEQRFGHDFSRVRMYSGGAAEQSAKDVSADAYTVGHNIVFGAGRYAPGTRAGQKLIAHELTHVVQQSGPDRIRVGENNHMSGLSSGSQLGAANTSAPSVQTLQCKPSAPAADEDVERSAILNVSKRTGDLERRAWELVWRMLTRYFPEYSPNISSVGYDEKEPGVRVQIRETEVKGKKMQTATVTVDKAFVEATSEENLRARITELRTSLSGLRAIPDPQAGAGMNTVWKVIQEKFAKKGGRLGGSSYDANLPGLRVEFSSGEVQAGKVKAAWAGPMLYYGKAFLALPDAEKEAKLGAELKKVDQWCVENARLRKADLDDEEITTRIRGLSDTGLMNLRDKLTDSDVQNFVASLLTISTPLTQGLTRQAGGAARVVMGNVTVIVNRDITNVTGMRGAHTGFDPPAVGPIPPTLNNHGIVSNFTPPGGLTITIQTRYGQGVSPDDSSGYGRGTTASDKAAGGKSLRMHEGSHGVEFIAMIARANQAHPYPSFTGAIGDTRRVFQAKVNQFDRERNAFFRAINAAQGRANRDVDCVGVTIDAYNQAHHIQSARICP